ncbi:unnamed protein product [Ceratitis capitata]|uniref:(Mediterranean fruit fly) hypothetical protein n=1 Tax=Ceratitis capitata TaxID=7213 RepID=A0A811UJK8_CERCA|nr:unnamed protein product [Ceratitis capitata]
MSRLYPIIYLGETFFFASANNNNYRPRTVDEDNPAQLAYLKAILDASVRSTQEKQEKPGTQVYSRN